MLCRSGALRLDKYGNLAQKEAAGQPVRHPAARFGSIHIFNRAIKVKGYANWRFSLGRLKKLPWDKAIATELIPVKAKSHKATGPRITGRCHGGVTRPSQSLVAWQCGYTSFSATAQKAKIDDHGHNSVGATIDPRYGCSVNMAESGNRLTRLHTSQVAGCGLNGWGIIVRLTQEQAQ